MSAGIAEFRVLGPLTAVDASGVPVPLGGAKQRCFLALLLLNQGRVLSVDTLIEEIWGEQPPPTAATMVHQYASRLRQVIQPAASLVTQKPGYLLEFAPGSLDANAFSSHLEKGRGLIADGNVAAGRRELAAGLGLWRGDALADLLYEPAVAVHAARLEEERLEAVEDRIRADLELGKTDGTVAELRHLVAQHPERERLVGLLMVALYRAGRQEEALAVYVTLRRNLAVELGLTPGREVEQLYEAILRHDPSLSRAPARRLRLGSRSVSAATAAAVALGAVALAAALAALGIVMSAPASNGGAKPLIPEDERLPFNAVPDNLLGSYSATIPAGQSPQTMTLRAADDPVCKPLLGGSGTCFLIHPVSNELDPGARGQAAFHDGKVVLRYVRIPFIPRCEREIDRYQVARGARQLVLEKRVIVMGPFDDCSFSAFSRIRES